MSYKIRFQDYEAVTTKTHQTLIKTDGKVNTCYYLHLFHISHNLNISQTNGISKQNK